MLLDRIDIDNHGPLNRVELGPFSEHLNVVYTPAGSGKTALARFIRDSLIDRDYPVGMLSSSAGRVVWAERNGKIHCRREMDGTNGGRRTIEFESRGESQLRFDWLHGSWIEGIADSTDASRALESIRIPESIVDGIVTDTAVTSVSRVIHACLLNGLDDPKLFASLPINPSAVSSLSPQPVVTSDTQQRVLRDELARIESELAAMNTNGRIAPSSGLFEREAKESHRTTLQSRLNDLRTLHRQSRLYPGQPLGRELTDLHQRIFSLRLRQIRLARWVAHLRSGYEPFVSSAPMPPHSFAHQPKSLAGIPGEPRWSHELELRTSELQQVTSELDRLDRRAAGFRYPLGLGSAPSRDAIESEINAVSAELRALDHRGVEPLFDTARLRWLHSRRSELIKQIGAPAVTEITSSPLADEASQWLVRLSGGRLNRVAWNAADFTTAPNKVAKATRVGLATIDGRAEAACPALDRALAALAIRLAAGDLLAATGRGVPLVIEAHHELLQLLPYTSTRYDDSVRHLPDFVDRPLNLAVLAALDDYSKKDRQVVVLASDTAFADQVARRGGKAFHIHGQRVAHEHRPLWRPHFGNESYAGPHSQTYPLVSPPAAAIENDPLRWTDSYIDRYHDESFEGIPAAATLADINRNLDTIWNEAYGHYPTASPFGERPDSRYNDVEPAYFGDLSTRPVVRRTTASAPAPPSESSWRDGYFYADNYTTQPHPAGSSKSTASETEDRSSLKRRNVSPFFLTVDSPIDQAPSIDAVAASRLRRLNVTHVNHLMDRDPNRLSDALGLAGVTAATIRRWQAECRLVCNVPQLRGFDARILVGCGITDAARLSATDPNHLLDRVEAFLSTERGQRILLSGTSYELSRITSWIATANIGVSEDSVIPIRDAKTVDGRVVRHSIRTNPTSAVSDRDRYEYEFVDDFGEIVRARSLRPRTGDRGKAKPVGRSFRSETGTSASRVKQSKRKGSRKELRSKRPGTGQPYRSQTHYVDLSQDSAPAADTLGPDTFELRFYLNRESPVVDAPSIGERMAGKLEAIGIVTVDDLLNADAADLADRLDHRRVDADVVTAWQNQAILVCRIPMLRGHDAQLLVAAEITTPEEVAEYEPSDLLELIDPIARSNEGKRILRGGNLPDLDEISNWIHFAQQNRELIAA